MDNIKQSLLTGIGALISDRKCKLYIMVVFTLLISQPTYSQSSKELSNLVNTYSFCVKNKDSVTFYQLFNHEPVTWGAIYTERTGLKENTGSLGNSYFQGSYKKFMRSLFKYNSVEDKFDNIHIVTDGTVATIMMDYSFWANGEMTNWGSKNLSLIKREGKWKITSVIYSIDLTKHFKQPGLSARKLQRGGI